MASESDRAHVAAAGRWTDMSASTREKSRPDTGQQTGVYVYGIVPGDVELNSGVHGVGDPPGEIRLVRSGDLAALVSEVDITKPLGTPEDLQTHVEILDAVITDAPVLPSRFGAVLTDEEAVAQELLDANHELRIQLGEIVNKAVADKRQADTHLLVSAMKDHCALSSVRVATNE